MTDRIAADEHARPAAEPAPAPGTSPAAGTAAAGGPRPGDPADRELGEVAEAMAQVRTAVQAPGAAPEVPDETEVAALEHAHETLRTTLDRIDRKV